MRGVVLLVFFGVASPTMAAAPVLTFDDIVLRALQDPALLARTAALARFERELATTGRYTREGPTLEAEIGPRRLEDGVVKTEALARIEVPFLSGRQARADADSHLRGAAGADVLAAEQVESRLRLKTAYLAAWLAQERLRVIEAQVETSEQLAATIKSRVESGAEAPYEAALVDGDVQRGRSESDAARTALGEAWASLRALAELPVEPQALASPGAFEPSVPADAETRFEAGLLRRSVAHRGALESAFIGLESAERRSRWSAAFTVSKEADESIATVGMAYRIPRRSEAAAASREREAAGAAVARVAQSDAARLATRFSTVMNRANRFGPVEPPGTFDDALRAIALRVELGKERPSLALPLRRQLLEAQTAALQRLHDAHLLQAEIDALLVGDAP